MEENIFMEKLVDKQIDDEIEKSNAEFAEIERIFRDKLEEITQEREQARNAAIDRFNTKTQRIYNNLQVIK